MRTIILIVSLLLASNLFAQNDSAFKSSIAPTYSGINTLTRNDIEKLPALNFMELVQGAFPFVANESAIEEEYSFIVNGFMLINPNAINISQIESICFFPASTTLTQGSSFKKGTFLITTRPQKSGLSFSSKTGLALANNTMPFYDIRKSGNGYYSFNDLTYSHRAKNSFLSSSFSFLKNKSPELTFVTPYTRVQTSSQVHSFQFSNMGGYQFNPHFRVEGGLFLTNKPQTAKDSLESAAGVNVLEKISGNKTINYGGAHAALIFSPSAQVNNQINTEITKFINKQKQHQDGFFINSGTTYDNRFTGRYTSYSFSDYFSWNALRSPIANIDMSVFARYRVSKTSENMFFQSLTSGQIPIVGGSISKEESKSFMVTPVLNLRIKKFLFAQAGATYDTYKNSQFAKTGKRTLLPEAGLKIEISSLLKNSVFSTLEVYGNYSKNLPVHETLDQFEDTYRSSSATAIYINSYPTVYPNPSINAYHPGEDLLGSLTIGVKHDRFVLTAQYRERKKYTRTYSLIYWSGGSGYIYQMQKLNGNGLCFELKSSLVEQQNKNWKLYTMIFQDNYSIKYPSTIVPVDGMLLDGGKAPWRGGLKTSASFKRIFLQASFLFSLNELTTDKSGNTDYDADRYNNNFLLVGYTIPLKKTRIKNLEINAQSRSLFYSHSYPLAKYVGIGAQLNF